jgi:hypothetical protein
MWHLYCIAASADDEDLLKFFIYGKHIKDIVFCLELHVDKVQKKISITTKAPTH